MCMKVYDCGESVIMWWYVIQYANIILMKEYDPRFC